MNSVHKFQRIHQVSIGVHQHKMQVRPGGVTGHTNLANFLTRAHAIAFVDSKSLQVRISRAKAVIMFNDQLVSADIVVVTAYHYTTRRSHDGSSHRRCDIHTVVEIRLSIQDAITKSTGDLSTYRERQRISTASLCIVENGIEHKAGANAENYFLNR